jgi:hypothetical protein
VKKVPSLVSQLASESSTGNSSPFCLRPVNSIIFPMTRASPVLSYRSKPCLWAPWNLSGMISVSGFPIASLLV